MIGIAQPQAQPASTAHVAEQPSIDALFPSSHASTPADTIPSPQRTEHAPVMHSPVAHGVPFATGVLVQVAAVHASAVH